MSLRYEVRMTALLKLSLRLDDDLNLVVRVLDLLVTLDIGLPDVSLTTADGPELVISRLSLSTDRFDVLRRRVAQMPGVRSVS